jgi:hypothetical protein
MSVVCPYCKRDYDITLFEFDHTIWCDCGKNVKLEHRELSGNFRDSGNDLAIDRFLENEKVAEIQRFADRIAFLIVSTDYPEFDILIEKEKLREKISGLFPDRTHLYELLYEPRFRRLDEQFRKGDTFRI